MKILYQGSPGAYSHLAALEVYPDSEIISSAVPTHNAAKFVYAPLMP